MLNLQTIFGDEPESQFQSVGGSCPASKPALPPAIRCHWCSGTVLVDMDGGLRCESCGQVAWFDESDGGIVRAGHATDDLVAICPPDACAQCGTLELWQTLAGNWRCQRCHPPKSFLPSTGLTARQLPIG